jgi:hypothetical protein
MTTIPAIATRSAHVLVSELCSSMKLALRSEVSAYFPPVVAQILADRGFRQGHRWRASERGGEGSSLGVGAVLGIWVGLCP